MGRTVFSICICLALMMGGCISSAKKEGVIEDVNGVGTHLPPEDYRPLLPSPSAAEQWESRRKPLPPLPEDYGRVDGSQPNVAPETDTFSEFEPPAEDALEPPIGDDLEPPASATSLKMVSPDDLNALVDSYRGKVLLLNCWGIDCGPCVEELPALNKILGELRSEGLAIVAINTDTESRHAEVEKFVQEKGYAIDFCLRTPGPDTKFRGAIDADYSADPFSVLFDKDGRTLATIADALSEEDWRGILTAAVKGNNLPITQSEYVRYF